MVQLKANLEKERNYNENGSTGFKPPNPQYSPLPKEGGLIHPNKVVISLVNPARWKLFNPTEEEMGLYGMSHEHVFGGDMDWGSLYFQVPTHRVMNYQYPSGTGFAQAICPNALNQYLTEGLGLSPLFDTPVKCAFCERESALWEDHNEAWASLGVDKRSLKTEGYKEMMNKHPILKSTREVAKNMRRVERYVLSVFDHDKFVGARPLDEGQTQVQWQSWYAPFSIYKGLNSLYKQKDQANLPMFFDFTRGAVDLMTVTKDTTGWTPNSKIKTDYSIQAVGDTYQYPEEWLAYLTSGQNYADPSEYLRLLTYEEQKYYVDQAGQAKQGYNKPASTHVDMGANQTPPTPAQTPPPAIPVAQVPPMPQNVPAPAPAPAAQPPVPSMPTPAVAPVPSAPVPPASPVPAIGGAPIPDRAPPVGAPAPGRADWD
jgi:hypothetical protein